MAKDGTVAYVAQMPDCQIHGMMGRKGVPAKYDFKTKDGPWAYGCEACWKDERAYPTLGVGKGQKLEIYPDPFGESDPAGQS